MSGNRNHQQPVGALAFALAIAAALLAGTARSQASSGEPAGAQSAVCAPARADSATSAIGIDSGRLVRAAPSEALRRLASEARALRSELREALAAAGTEPDARRRHDLLVRLAAVARRAMALPDEMALPRVLVHLHHSLVLLDPDLAVTLDGKQTGALCAAWLTRAASGASGEADRALAAHARAELAEIHERAGRAKDAMRLARQAAFDAARAPHPETLYRARWLIGRLHRAAGEDARAREAYRSAVATLETIKAGVVARASDEAFSFRRQVEPVYLGLVDLLLVAARGTHETDPRLGQRLLREARDVIELSKQAELRDYFEDECLAASPVADPDSVPGAVVVYPIALDDRVEIIVSRNGRLSSHLAPIDGTQLDRLARGLRSALEDRMTLRYRPPAEALYDALVRPISRRLQEAPVSTLVFVPGGSLRQIPMAVLRDRETDTHLIETYPIAITPSLSLTVQRPITPSRVRMLTGGLTQSVQGFAPLPRVAWEVEEVGRHFSTRTLLDEAFVSDEVERALRAVPYDVLHIASHAEFAANPEDSFILTWDGRLSLERLAATLGQARFRAERPVELLVLSACETAAGDERSALGLAGAALRMGVRSVLASLWAVNDDASSRLMARFYRELANSEHTRASALQAAQLWMLRQDDFEHPIDWAAFLLISGWL